MIKRIITFIILILAIIVLIFVASKVIEQGKSVVTEVTAQTESTDMLTIQAKEKAIADNAILKDDTSFYIGEKLSETEIPEVKELIESGIISEEEEEYESYYVWNQEILNSQGINVTLKKNEFYVVNYETDEIVSTNSIKNSDGTECYRLSEFKEKITEAESVESTVEEN